MAEPLVRYESGDAGVARITLQAPPADTYSYDMMRELDAAVLEARMDDAVHVIVVRGAGDRFFCAGADIGMLQRATPRFEYYFCLHANETLLRLENTPKLVIAAINGHCVGGGFEVALACDLARLLGKAKALELMAAGRLLEMEQAREAGLVHEVIPAADDAAFDAAVGERARAFAPPGRASRAVGLIKRAVQSGAEGSLAEGLALERELQQQLFESEDAREGLAASLEKRKPVFQGR
jgi:enoyl-CoA hydratase/carnithine racemase